MSDDCKKNVAGSRNRFFKVIISCFAIAAALILGVSLFLVFMLFSSPEKVEVKQPDAIDFSHQIRISRKLFSQMRNEPARLRTMTLSEEEVNSAIRCAVFYYDKFSKSDADIAPGDLCLKYKKGLFSGVIPLDTGIRLLNGGVIKLRFAAEVKKEPKKLHVDVKRVCAGKIALPPERVNVEVQKYLESNDARDIVSKIDDIFEGVAALPDGRLQLTYYPEKLMRVVLLQVQ